MSVAAGPKMISDNLILYLDAGNSNSYPGTGTLWTDRSKQGNNGTLTNGPTFNSNNLGSIVFDGDNDFVDLGTITTSNSLQLNNPAGGGLTVMYAANYDGVGDSYQRIIDKSNGVNATNGWSIYGNLGYPTLEADVNGGIQTIAPIANLTWQFWAVTWQKSSGAWAWYLNGELDNSGTQTYNIPSVQTTARIGTWNHSTGREFNGKLGFILVYDRVLSASEVKQNFNALRGRYGL